MSGQEERRRADRRQVDRTAPRCRLCHHVTHPEGPCPGDGLCDCRRNDPLLLPGVHTLTE